MGTEGGFPRGDPKNYPILPKITMSLQSDIEKAYELIYSFPKSNSGKPFLMMKSGRKVFFDIFIRKYGLDGTATKYSQADVARRMRLSEFFSYILSEYDITEQEA
jgi:hypothetical protein